MKNKMADYKELFSNKKFLTSAIMAIVFLGIGLVANFYGGVYATESASSPVTDIILSNTKAYDLDGVFIYGTFLLIFCSIFVSLYDPKTIPFVGKSVGLFYVIRSIFISLTHIGPFPSQIVIHSDLLSKFTFAGDLFFSGHTGLPFLMALIFWRNKKVRNFFICFSVAFGIVVLLAHMHYSIDVLSAFFITYTIFHIAEFLFEKDRRLFYRGLTTNTESIRSTTISAFKGSIN